MKKIWALVLIVICFFSVAGCHKDNEEIHSSIKEETQQTETSALIPVPQDQCRLIVNGKDITQSAYVSIDYSVYTVEIPVLAIFRELGYDAQMQYVEETDSYIALIDQETILLDTQYDDYGLHAWIPTKYVRRMQDGDFIVDSRSLANSVYWQYNIDINVDYHSGIVYVDSFDMFDCEEIECSLIVNGKDITKDNCAHILEFYTETVVALPLLAIATELGAEVEWQSETVVAITYNGETKTYDTTDSEFNIPVMAGSICIRKIVDGDLIFDLLSIEGTLNQEYGVSVSVDKENNIVYIDSV